MYYCIVKRSEIHQHIVETASRLFYENGYNSTGINEIIAESGIAKATLYNHFKSKEDICVAYLDYKESNFQSNLKAHCMTQNAGKDQIYAIFDFLDSFYHSEGFQGCWCVRTVSEIPYDNEKIRNAIVSHKNNFIQLILDLLEANDIQFFAKSQEELAKQIYLLYEGAVAESYLHRAPWPIDESKKLIKAII